MRTGKHSVSAFSVESEKVALFRDINTDLSGIAQQINTIYKPLVNGLAQFEGLVPLELGISGNIIYANQEANSASSAAFWDSSIKRKRTVKESFEYLLSEQNRLEDLFEALESQTTDLSDVLANLSVIELNLDQIIKDSFGNNYSLDNDGNADLIYSLAQTLDAIGSLFTGYESTGLTYDLTYPSLSLTVNLSDINVDTTLPQSAIEDLGTNLSAIRTFIGMATVSDTPDYDDYGMMTVLVNGWSLERGIAELDLAIADLSLQDIYDSGPAASAGTITVDAAQGAFTIKSPVAMSTIQQWYTVDSGDILKYKMTEEALEFNETSAGFYPRSSGTPGITSTEGHVYTKDVSSTTELYYVDNNSTDIGVTRNGRVREYLVGKDSYLPNVFEYNAPSSISSYTTAGGMKYPMLLLTNANTEYIYLPLSVPECDDGTRPEYLKVQVFSKPGGVTSGNYEYGIGVSANRKTGGSGPYEIIEDGEDVDVTWQSESLDLTGNIPTPSEEDFLHIHSFELDLESPTPEGILPLRIRREPADANDTYPDSVGIVKIAVSWWRQA